METYSIGRDARGHFRNTNIHVSNVGEGEKSDELESQLEEELEDK